MRRKSTGWSVSPSAPFPVAGSVVYSGIDGAAHGPSVLFAEDGGTGDDAEKTRPDIVAAVVEG
ncbi:MULTISPECIES: hypothetical protein [Acetobacter]|uniref:Uncharacterized protein n=1 Tax=Acetobacter sacchari TaxID=2661687 RepID=A0ABS3LT36_9PROT|nr:MULTISPECIES: hypothetical protein [Acetobacter]MBO1359059.1 hypothetical protein [Acetobacter sacchari]